MTLAQDTIVLQPQTVLQDDEVDFTIILEGVTTVLDDADLTMTAYRGTTNVTDTFFSGSMSRTNGPPARITTKVTQALKAADELVVTVYGNMDGRKEGRQFTLHVRGNDGRI